MTHQVLFIQSGGEGAHDTWNNDMSEIAADIRRLKAVRA
jgi:hypothetical protein